MPLPNRVAPTGDIVADPSRGTVMGNRGGMFHDPAARALRGRRWALRRWLCCALDYPGRHAHPVWSRGYTQLFFLDEVTALAAGHRPCAECRRPAALAFREALGEPTPPSLDAIDRRLHGERLRPQAGERPRARCDELPDGAMVASGGTMAALRGGMLLPWSFSGYGPPERPPPGQIDTLTPPTSLQALRGGYRPLWHPTADRDAPGP